MTLCSQCGMTMNDLISTEQGVCTFHTHIIGDAWAEGNRVMCDFFHRGVIHPELSGEILDSDEIPF